MKEKNYGVEFGRILSMLMIMGLHVLGQGGILGELGYNSLKGQAVVYLEYLCVVSVNIFALISGFVAVNSQFKLRRLIGLWLQMMFFSVGMMLIIGPLYHISFNQVIESFFPTIHHGYWYFNAYLILYIFTPILNKGIKALRKKELFQLLVIAFFVLSIVSSFAVRDAMYVEGGYSPIWLIYMYVVGAYIKIHGIPNLIRKRKLMLFCYFLFGILTLVAHDLRNLYLVYFDGFEGQDWWVRRYSFPTIFIMSVALFLYLISMKFPKRMHKMIGFFSTSALAAYLFQTHPLFYNIVLPGMFTKIAEQTSLLLLGNVVLLSVFFFVAGVLLDKLRLWLVQQLKLDRMMDSMYAYIERKFI